MKSKKHDPLNIIIMRKTGRLYSLDVSPKMLIIGVVFLLIFIVLSVTIINRYTDVYLENKKLQQRVGRLSKTLEDYQYQSQVLTQYQKLVNELNRVDQKKEAVDSQTPTEGAPASDSVAAAANNGTAGQEGQPATSSTEAPSDTVAPEVSVPATSLIDVEKLSLVPNESADTVKFQFVLNNIDPENKNISGYLFIILTDSSTDPPRIAAYPEAELKDGLPTDYKKGTLFSIKHGKTVKGQIDHLDKAAEYDQAWILAFSEQGELLMKKHLSSDNG